MNNKYFKYLVLSLLSAITIGLSLVMADETVPEINQPTHVLQRVTVPKTNYEVGMGIGEMAPNTMKSRRVQSGPEMVYVLEGELVLMVEGQPAKTIEAGESFQIQAGVLHETKAGSKGAKFLATWIVEQGKRDQFVVPIK